MIGGEDVTGRPSSKRDLSMVFQSYALFPHLSVAENIVFGLKVRRVARADRDERLHQVADLLGLTQLLDRKPGSAFRWSAAKGCAGPGHHRGKTDLPDG